MCIRPRVDRRQAHPTSRALRTAEQAKGTHERRATRTSRAGQLERADLLAGSGGPECDIRYIIRLSSCVLRQAHGLSVRQALAFSVRFPPSGCGGLQSPAPGSSLRLVSPSGCGGFMASR